MLRAAALLVVALALGACSKNVESADPEGSASAKPAYGDTYIDSLLGNISGLIPNVTSDASSHTVGGMIYSGLIDHDGDLKVVPQLATSWSFSGDCRELTFQLRPGVRWHDGHPFTADDVVFTWQTMVNPKTPTAYKDDFLAIERAEAPDPLTVRLFYKYPYAKALESWGTTILPRHLLESYVRQGRLREAPENLSRPVGTGPYRFAEWRPGERVVLVANPDYFEGRPYISRVVYRIIPSQATTFMELKARGIDAASLTALQYKRQTDYPAFRKWYNKYRYPSNGYTYLGFNLRDPRFADARVRRAIAHAIDIQALIDHVVLGLGRATTGPFKPGTWAYNNDVRGYSHDPARAQALLAEAGWKERNAEGLLVRHGEPFTFELLTNQGNEERRKIAEIVQASLRDVGIGVEVRTIEWATLLKEYINKRRFQAIVLGWGVGIDPDQYLIWHSSKTGPDELNFISYANREVDELLEKGRSTCRQQDRVDYYHRIHELIARDEPLVFLYFRDALPAVSSRVHGIVPAPNGITYNFIHWFVPKPQQRYTAG